MRILVFCSADLSRGSGSEIRGRMIAQGLKAAGAEVAVVSSGAPASFASQGIPAFLPGREGRWKKIIAAAAERFAPDLLYGVTEAFVDAVADVAAARRIPFALDLHGIGVVEVLELGPGHGSRVLRAWQSISWLARARKAAAITVANPTLVPLIARLNARAWPVIGMTDVELFRPDGAARRPPAAEGAVHVLYAGNYFKWQGVELLVEATRRLLVDRDLHFTFIGSVGVNTALVDRWKAELPVGRVTFLESVPVEQIVDYYRGADVLVIPRPFMWSTHLAFPQKLVDYLAAGRTVVATDLAPHRWALASPRCGILCAPDATGISDAIRCAKDPKLRVELGAAARQKAVAEFSHLSQAARLLDILEGSRSVRS